MKNRVTKGTALAEAIQVGGGSVIDNLKVGTVAVDPASLAANSKAGTAVTVAGARAGDVVVMNPPSDLHDDLVFTGALVTDTDEVTVYLYNPTGGAIDGASKTWTYLLVGAGS